MANSKIIVHPESQKAIEKLKPEARKFIDDLIAFCILNDVTVKIYDKVTYKGALGWFDCDRNELVICTRGKVVDQKDNWLTTAIHESCHLDQWLEKCKVEREYFKLSEKYNIHDWLDHKIELTPIQVSKAIRIVQDHELDCEKRSVKKMVEYNLSHIINISLYIKNANHALFNYSILRETRKWPDWRKVRGKYRKLFVDQPDYFLVSYKYIPTWFRRLVLEIV